MSIVKLLIPSTCTSLNKFFYRIELKFLMKYINFIKFDQIKY